jgi:hypothetical protein
MSVEQFEGKRTGRKKGGKNRPQWQRDLEWTYKNLGKPDSEALSDGARFWRAVAREQPDKFAAALAQLDSADNRKPEAPVIRTSPEATPAVEKVAVKSQRAKMVFLSLDHLGQLLKCQGVPDDARVSAATLTRNPGGLWVTLRSSSFPLVDAGQPIPELKPAFATGR